MSNHCKIGITTLILAICAGISGGVAALLFQINHFYPIINIANTSGFMQNLTQTHARMMVFFVLQPALMLGFGVYFVPLLIEARDMAFGFMNSLSLFLMMIGFGLNFITFFQPEITILPLLSLSLWAISGILFSANMIITIIDHRAKNIHFSDLPLFVWAQGIGAVLLLPTASVLLAALTKDYLSYSNNLTMVLQQTVHHFTYPILMVLVVPAIGIIFHVINTISDYKLQTPKTLVAFMGGVALMAFVIWNKSIMGHALWDTYTNKIDSAFSLLLYGFMTCLILCCMVSFYKGKKSYPTPVLWVFGFIFLSVFGWPYIGITKGMNEIHSCITYAMVFAVFAGFYFWMGRITGKQYSETLGKLHFATTFISVLLTMDFFSLGYMSVLTGSVLMAVSLLIFVMVLMNAMKSQVSFPYNYWGSGATTHEWRSSTAIIHYYK